MVKFKSYQQLVLAVLASITLFLIGLAILGISLWSANQDAVGIQQLF
jgi:hypothetical protein